MTSFLIKPDSDQYNTKLDEDEPLHILRDDQDSGGHVVQIGNIHRPSKNEPSTSLDSEYELTDYVNELVKHKTKLSAANFIAAEDTVDVFVKGIIDRNNEAFVPDPSRNREHVKGKPQTRVLSKHSNSNTFTNDDLKRLGVEYINKDELLPLDRILDAPLDSHKPQLDSKNRFDTDNKSAVSDLTREGISLNVEKTRNISKIPSVTKTNHFGHSLDRETEEALKEYEKDILYLSGCNNKTSTPEKHVPESPIKLCDRKFPDFKHPRSQNISPKRSPYRRFVRPISPLVASSVKTNSNSSSTTESLLRLLEHFKNTDDNVQHDPNVHTRVNKNLVNGEPLLNISPASERWMTQATLAHTRRGARRSLFSDQTGLGRFLPMTSLKTNKPLGYDAFQQFMSVTKSDVLPKYFFENEDEEAVYYLKVKYLDEGK